MAASASPSKTLPRKYSPGTGLRLPTFHPPNRPHLPPTRDLAPAKRPYGSHRRRYQVLASRTHMVKPPRAVGPLLCRDVFLAPNTATLSLVGLFNTRSYAQWPSPVDPFFFYALLVGGEGDGLIEFTVLRAATEQMIYRYRRWYAVPAPDFPVHFLQRV